MEWTWLDISTYVFQNIGGFVLGWVICVIVCSVTVAVYKENKHWREKEGIVPSRLYRVAIVFSILFMLVSSALGFMPTHNKILEIKIERIKNEAVSKENIDKGLDTLERVGKKLECKYLGGLDCKK